MVEFNKAKLYNSRSRRSETAEPWNTVVSEMKRTSLYGRREMT